MSRVGGFLSRYAGFICKLVSAVAVVAVLVGYSSWASATSAADEAVREQMAEAQRADTSQRGPYATDGTFTGTGQGYGGAVSVNVVIANGYIESVEVTDHAGETEPYFSMASTLTDEVVTAQTTSVDTVSGATMSSAGILNATTDALQQSMAGSGSSGGE